MSNLFPQIFESVYKNLEDLVAFPRSYDYDGIYIYSISTYKNGTFVNIKSESKNET